MILDLQHVYFKYPKQDSFQIEDVSFSLKRGDTYTLVGPNGAGKTTLVKLVLGILEPSQGQIKKPKNTVVSYIPQKTDGHRLPMTVNRFMHLSSDEKLDQDIIDAMLEKLSLTDILNKDIKQLSGGQWQRVLLARALLRSPDLLILDEPVSGVDVSAQDIFYAILQDIKKDCAILMVSHDLHLVMASTSKVICLNNHVCCIGEPEEIKNSAAFQKLFGTKYLRPYHHHHDHNHV